MMRASVIGLVLFAAACTIEKKENAPSDSVTVVVPGATVTVPPATTATPLSAPAPSATTPSVAPSSTRSRRDSTKSLPMPPKKMKIEPMVGGERDSAFEPVMGVGADGKLHPIKK